MRIGLISDIHGNVVALQSVLQELHRKSADRIVCLGDVVSYGPDPVGVIDALRKVGAEIVMGNMDAWALDPSELTIDLPHADRIGEIHRWSAERLGIAELAVLRALPASLTVTISCDMELLACHGSPRSPEEPMLPNMSQEDLRAAIHGLSSSIVACGHTHLQLLWHAGKVTIINPGSVGYALRGPEGPTVRKYPCSGDYALLAIHDGITEFEFSSARFDLNDLIRSAEKAGMPHLKWWCSLWDESA